MEIDGPWTRDEKGIAKNGKQTRNLIIGCLCVVLLTVILLDLCWR